MIETIELAAGVTLLAVQTEKFKSGCFSFNLMRPHPRAAAPLDALLPSVLLPSAKVWKLSPSPALSLSSVRSVWATAIWALVC